MEPKLIFDKLKSKFADEVLDFKSEGNSDPFIIIKPDKLVDICLFLRDDEELLFDYLMLLGAVDNKTNITVVYHLYSTIINHKITFKVILDREKPSLPSVEKVWKAANWHEREAYDMLGVKFEGHPNLIRILCPYDWEGFPLRKDYNTPETYHGIKVPY